MEIKKGSTVRLVDECLTRDFFGYTEEHVGYQEKFIVEDVCIEPEQKEKYVVDAATGFKYHVDDVELVVV